MQQENNQLQTNCEDLKNELELSRQKVLKLEANEKLLDSELAELKKTLIENIKASGVKADNESKCLEMLNNKDKEIKEQQKTIKEKENVIQKLNASIQAKTKEHNLKEAARKRKEKEFKSQIEKQSEQLKEKEQNIEELKQAVATSNETVSLIVTQPLLTRPIMWEVTFFDRF